MKTLIFAGEIVPIVVIVTVLPKKYWTMKTPVRSLMLLMIFMTGMTGSTG
jgi:hypothetical protein